MLRGGNLHRGLHRGLPPIRASHGQIGNDDHPAVISGLPTTASRPGKSFARPDIIACKIAANPGYLAARSNAMRTSAKVHPVSLYTEIIGLSP